MKQCLYCGAEFEGVTSKKYCSNSCKQLDYVRRKKGGTANQNKREWVRKTPSASLKGIEVPVSVSIQVVDKGYVQSLRKEIELTQQLLTQQQQQQRTLTMVISDTYGIPASVWCPFATAALTAVIAGQIEKANQWIIMLSAAGGGVVGYFVGNELDKHQEQRRKQILTQIETQLDITNTQINATTHRLNLYLHEYRTQAEIAKRAKEQTKALEAQRRKDESKALKQAINTTTAAQTTGIPSTATVTRKNSSMARNGPEKALFGQTMNAAELVKMKFETLPFTGEWLDLIGEPAPGFAAMVYGEPKSGKSTFCLKLADYLTKFGNVLYVSSEEGHTKTTQNKLNQVGATSPHIDITERPNFKGLKTTLANKPYAFAFIDSANHMGMDANQVEELRRLYPDTSFIVILQATKDGKFKGGKEFEHNVDVVIKVAEGSAYSVGRFAPPGCMQIFERLPTPVEDPHLRTLL